MQGFKTLEDAQAFKESVVGDYLIVGQIGRAHV